LSTLSLFTTYEKNHSFVECATFADDGFTRGFRDQFDWHFIDTPYFTDGYNDDHPFISEQNVEWAIVKSND
jgi:hypothetical protein